MFVNMEQIKIGVSNYVEQEIAKQADGVHRFLYYFALPRVNKKVEGFVSSFRDNPMADDLFDEHGNVNLDKLYNESLEAIRKSGKFVYFGIWVSEDTLKTIYSYIAR